MKKKRRLFQKKKHEKEEGQVELQITSMADIFTILLVFLLKGIASDAIQITPSNDTRLPASVYTKSLDQDVLQVEISKAGVLVAKEMTSSLEDLKPLNERLRKEREKQKLISESNDSVKNDERVVVLSDESITFQNLKPILNTLAANGYSEVHYAVIKGE